MRPAPHGESAIVPASPRRAIAATFIIPWLSTDVRRSWRLDGGEIIALTALVLNYKLRLHHLNVTNYGFSIYTQVRMTNLLVMLSVAVRRIRRIRVQVLVIFRARGISFARPVAPPPEVSIANPACVGSLKSEA